MTPHLPIDKEKPRFDAFSGNFWTSLSECTDPHVIVWSLRGTLLFANTCRTFTTGPMHSLPPSLALHRLLSRGTVGSSRCHACITCVPQHEIEGAFGLGVRFRRLKCWRMKLRVFKLRRIFSKHVKVYETFMKFF